MKHITDEALHNEVIDTFSAAGREGRNDDVIRDGLLLYMAARSDEREVARTLPLVYVQAAIERIMRGLEGAKEAETVSSQDQACSFCGLKPPAVRLGAGPTVFICDRCVSVFHDHFNDHEKEGSRGTE
jgi:hypothetical protein